MENRCVRCESLDRKQKSKKITFVLIAGEKVPICSVCMLELEEEQEFIYFLKEDAEGSEAFD